MSNSLHFKSQMLIISSQPSLSPYKKSILMGELSTEGVTGINGNYFYLVQTTTQPDTAAIQDKQKLEILQELLIPEPYSPMQNLPLGDETTQVWVVPR